ncbi:MAG TPA: NUDIX domain-containing protein [Balneolaceae bacterium]|nr:NUDIX domain-containing protein [Balneolaceae bacterium]
MLLEGKSNNLWICERKQGRVFVDFHNKLHHMDYSYSEHAQYYVALDCIIFGFDRKNLKLLLIKRNFEPKKGEWSLMGSFLRPDESLDEAAGRILYNLTGLTDIYLEQLKGFGEVDRDPVARTISVAYYALINIHGHNEKLLPENGAKWFHMNELPDLIFDHEEMVLLAKKRLRQKASSQPVGFELLPDTFTLPELQQLYEAIYETDLDKRNFRRRILSMNVLEKTDKKQKKYSKKGAYLYKFDEEKYSDQKGKNGGSKMMFKPPKV